jgi:hypothetical protein
MAQTPEGKVKDALKKVLNEWKCYYHMPVQNGMGKPTLDFVCCFRGNFFSVETKAPGKKMSARQLNTQREMEAAGAEVFMIDGDMTELEEWFASFILEE